ncbi:protein moonraker isoform 2-T2 [Pholidichthys leucotaenia]
MTAQLVRCVPVISMGQHNQERKWVAFGSARSDLTTGVSQTKLLFSEAIPANTSNRATRVGPPAPIVIERLLPLSEVHSNVESTRSSISFTALSEEKLHAAVKLAKRDLRRRRLESLTKASIKPSQGTSLFETSDVEMLQELAATPSKMKSKASNSKEKGTPPGTKRHSSQQHPLSPMPRVGLSPPTRDSGPRLVEGAKEAPLSYEIRKLQNELEVYIQKVEELANKGEKSEVPLEPEEQNKLETRRQKQAARSAQNIYVLQQQVKEIQEDIAKLRSQKMWETKKTVAINRLAAAHRGALRALQVFIHQLTDLPHTRVPSHYKELGRLIRQLSLCSAKVEADQSSAVPETALDILQKLEALDSALDKQELLQKMRASACPPHGKSTHHSMPPVAAPKDPITLTAQGPRKPTNPRKGVHGRRMTLQKTNPPHQPMNRREVLRAGLENIIQQREPKGRAQTTSISQKRLHPERSKAGIIKRSQMEDPGFQQPTVSSRLRVNQLPQKEHSVPWIPVSPHSPPPSQQSPHRGRPEPRCLFSPEKPSSSPPKQRVSVGGEKEPTLSLEKKKEAQDEALRSEIVSPTQWAERAEQKARERIQPLLDEAQQIQESRNHFSSLRTHLSEQAAERAAERAEQLSEALLEDLLEDTAQVAWAAETDRQLEGMAQHRLQASTLESMLLRMEEIQRDQDEVRRRFASIAYSDSLYWDRPRGSQTHDLGSRPTSPQPIRLTRPVLKQTSAADIVLEKPVETGFLCENSLTEEASQDQQQPIGSTVFPCPADRSIRTVLSVPGSMLRNIRQYREDYNSYLRIVTHKAIGSLNPWAVADRVAEELLSEALADVAAEFQDVVEEYAEAVFTSEFLQPIQSPPASAAPLIT